MISPSLSAPSGLQPLPSSSQSASECLPSASEFSATLPARYGVSGTSLPTIVRLVGQLHAYEETLARLFADGGRLSVAVADAQAAETRRLGHLGAHDVAAAFADAHALVEQAIQRIADGHRKLSRIGKTIGYDFDGASGFGDGQKDPSSLMSVLVSLVADGASTETAN